MTNFLFSIPSNPGGHCRTAAILRLTASRPHSLLTRLIVWCLGLVLGLMFGAAQAAAPSADWWSAIKRDDVSAVQNMLLRGVDPTAFNEIGNPALTQAAREQSWKVFDTLRIAAKVRIDQPNRLDETALMYLCILGQTERAQSLIAAGAQVNRLGWTPLHYAASRAQLDTARMLIQRGAIINAPGPDGTTPLMMAALSGKGSMVRLLVEHGADATMFNAKHETAADWAFKGKHATLAKTLDDLSRQMSRQRQEAAGVAPAVPRADAAAPQTAAKKPAPEDSSSTSRYFDLSRFEDIPAGQ